MVKLFLDRPWLLALIAPSLLTGVPLVIGYLAKAGLKKLTGAGSPATQKAVKATIKAWVLWAEEEHLLPGQGEVKFGKVDAIVAGLFPWLPADQRKTLIEGALKELDADAHSAVDDAT